MYQQRTDRRMHRLVSHRGFRQKPCRLMWKLRREALEKAAVEADEITSTAKEDAERIRGEAEEKARTLYEEQKKLGYEEGPDAGKKN